jgi:hypothetical protein
MERFQVARTEPVSSQWTRDQKIPPEILHRQELALVGQAEMGFTFPDRGPRVSFDGVDSSLVRRLDPHDDHVINGEIGSLVKTARFSSSPRPAVEFTGAAVKGLSGQHEIRCPAPKGASDSENKSGYR